MKTIHLVRSITARKTAASVCAAAAATLMAACSPPVTQDDGGADAIAADTSNGSDSARNDGSSDGTITADSANDSANDSALGNDADTADASAMDVADIDSAPDATSMDSAMMDALSADSRADSAPDALPDSAPDVSCRAGQTSCAGRCVDTQTDILNCGACGTVCPPPPSGMVACIAARCGAVPGTQTTQPTGSGAAITLGQPTLAVTMVLAPTGIFPSRDTFSAGSALGMVHLFAGNFGPNGAPMAAGQVIGIASNTALFSLLGTTYGGDGRATFAFPDLRDRMIVAAGMGAGLPNATLGGVFGNASATLTIATMAAHSHLLVDGVTRTSSTGNNVAIDPRAPTMPLTAWVATEGIFPSMSAGAQMPFMGQIRWFAGGFTPTGGWVPADGRLLSIAEFSALYAIIGTSYGGNGTTTFAVPDLRGRTPIGTGAATGGPTIALGQFVGSSSTVITAAQLPTHQHALAGGGATQTTGNSQPVSMYQPSLGITWMIATQGIFPARDGSGSFDDTNPVLGEIFAFAGTFAPRGFLKAEGQLLPIAMNTALFSLLGTQYGGDGRTNFALPDLRGRAPVGASAANPVGTQQGAVSRTLTIANLPAHTHGY